MRNAWNNKKINNHNNHYCVKWGDDKSRNMERMKMSICLFGDRLSVMYKPGNEPRNYPNVSNVAGCRLTDLLKAINYSHSANSNPRENASPSHPHGSMPCVPVPRYWGLNTCDTFNIKCSHATRSRTDIHI